MKSSLHLPARAAALCAEAIAGTRDAAGPLVTPERAADLCVDALARTLADVLTPAALAVLQAPHGNTFRRAIAATIRARDGLLWQRIVDAYGPAPGTRYRQEALRAQLSAGPEEESP